jgi:hypothetical protein
MDEEYFVWNQFRGVEGSGSATIEKIEKDKHGRKARMAEPFGSKMAHTMALVRNGKRRTVNNSSGPKT